MPSLPNGNALVATAFDLALDADEFTTSFEKRVKIPINSTTPPQLVNAIQQDPWSLAGKYGLGWVYFGIILLVATSLIRLYHLWGDKIRIALFKEEVINSAHTLSPDSAMPNSAMTDTSNRRFFPPTGPLVPEKLAYQPQQTVASTIAPINNTIALFRWVFYRPIPSIKIGKTIKFVFPALGVVVVAFLGLAFSLLYCFLPRPLYYASMSFGSPPLAIRAGMLAVSLLPWIVATAAKANFISILTGVSHERLLVFHRWGAYLCAILSIIHAVPFWYQSVRDPHGFATYKLYFFQPYYIFLTGICAIAPLAFLCLHSLPILRRKAYEFFVVLHIPVACLFVGMMVWHCANHLTSWSYLISTIVLMVLSWLLRLFYLNWTNPFRASWLIGEESAVTILPENAVKVTIPTQKRWNPGQYVYLRMPGIAFLDNHPFTIASLCSEDFPSEYGDQYRDMILVFRPFGGFTKKLFDTAVQKGPYKTYRAYIDGPYGGMRRPLSSFDQVIFFAGGSGITAIASQLLDLIKRMRDGKATTFQVKVVWAMKRPELMEWFKEELRICREYGPADSLHCHFYITASKRVSAIEGLDQTQRHSGFFSDKINEKVNSALQGLASKRNSALVMPDGEAELRYEGADHITELPPVFPGPPRNAYVHGQVHDPRTNRMSTLSQAQLDAARNFDFGFPQTPTRFQKNLMRFAFLPSHAKKDGWRTEYGRPDIPYMLKGFSKTFGRRTCVYVCGPPGMRIDVANTVAKLQSDVWSNSGKDEIYLHAENYAI